MKLSTSRILAQLSEQDRNKVEMELAELHGRNQQLSCRKNDVVDHIKQLNQQRDQAIRNRNAAALLQAFDLSLNEQRSQLANTMAAMHKLEQQKQSLLSRFADVYRTQHAYESIHDKQQHRQRKQAEQKSQRQLDDLVAARISLAAS